MADPFTGTSSSARIQWVILIIAAACLVMEVIRLSAEVTAVAQLRKDHDSAYSRLENRVQTLEGDTGNVGTANQGGGGGSAMQVAREAQSTAESTSEKVDRALEDIKDIKDGRLTLKDPNSGGHIEEGFFKDGGSYLRMYDSHGNLRAELGESSSGTYCIWLFKSVSSNPSSEGSWTNCNP